GHRDQNSLAHAATQFVRKRVGDAGGIGDGNHVEQVESMPKSGPAVQRWLFGSYHVDQLCSDRQHRIEPSSRIGDDETEVMGSEGLQLSVVETDQFPAGVSNASSSDVARWLG